MTLNGCSYYCSKLHYDKLFFRRLRLHKLHCIRPSTGQAVANSALESKRLDTPDLDNNCDTVH